MTEDSVVAARFQSERLAAAPYNRFTIKRPLFYRWLADKAAAAGAQILFGSTVKTVLFTEGNQADGVLATNRKNTKYLADIVVLADGANSLLA